MKILSPKTKFRVTILGICVIISFCGFSYVLISNLLKISSNNNDMISLQEKYDEELNKEQYLKKEINKLKDSEYLAKYTREKYLYSAVDEIIIKFEDKDE